MKTILLTLALLAAASAQQAGAIEHIFDTADATRIKNEIVSAMLDADFTLQEDTQYKLVFAKQVNINRPSGIRSRLPAIVRVSFTVVPQSDKTRLSVFCLVNGLDAISRALEPTGQRQYDAWLDKFFRALTAKIEKPVSSQSNPAAADFAKYASKLREQEIDNLESSDASSSPSPTATSKDK